MRRNEYQQFLQITAAAFFLEYITQARNIFKKRYTGPAITGGFFVQTADHNGLAVKLDHIRFGFFGKNCWLSLDFIDKVGLVLVDVDIHFKGFVVDDMRGDVQPEHGFFIFDIDFTVFNGLERNVAAAFNKGGLVLQGGNLRTGKNVELTLILQGRKLHIQKHIAHSLIDQAQRKGRKSPQRIRR